MTNGRVCLIRRLNDFDERFVFGGQYIWCDQHGNAQLLQLFAIVGIDECPVRINTEEKNHRQVHAD